MYRGELNWLLGTPNPPGVDRSAPGWLEKKESGPLPNITWLNALTNCTSKRVDTRSVMRVVFAKPKSTFQRNGPRMAPNPRVLSAKVGYRKRPVAVGHCSTVTQATASGFWNAFGTPPVLPVP